MKLKLLLFSLLLTGGILSARGSVETTQQDTMKGLIFSESFGNSGWSGYWEITNMNSFDVNLGEVEFGVMVPWGSPGNEWNPGDRRMMLPNHILHPGESFVIANCYDFNPEQFAKGLEGYGEKFTRDQIWDLADLQIHFEEKFSIPGLDSITPGADFLSDIWSGSKCFFLRQHFNETDSLVLDQVGGVFDDENGTNYDYAYDVAGITGATGNSVLVRKYSIKTGNLDFANARGIDEDDSEWIVVKNKPDNYWRDVYWTLGNHGDYKLDANTLESDVAQVDFAAKTITVPWGTLRGDGIMHLMTQKPGIAWNYIESPNYEDSLSYAAHTGDQLLVVACGNDGERATFDIIVSDPPANANFVVPVLDQDPTGWWRREIEGGYIGWPRITTHASGIDTIWGARGGIPYATRIDSLFERLEKPAGASWEFICADGAERVDVKEGDKLKVTASNGTVKEYYISVLPYRANTDATLTAITWPDIPEFYYDLFGWVGDTIPGFGAAVYDYKIKIPMDVEQVPAFVAKAANTNAKIKVKRANNLTGTAEDRTMSFTVTAEADTVVKTYSIELSKEKDPSKLQPYSADPFISEFIEAEQWGNSYMELCNPGNQPLDMSNYMIVNMWANANPVDAIKAVSSPESWNSRFTKYIPGYKWVDKATWEVTPGLATQDLSVNPIVMGGDVFCMGGITYMGELYSTRDADFFTSVILSKLDVQFRNVTAPFLTVKNPWEEEVTDDPVASWMQGNYFVFKILNDSIKSGDKPANDPNDFQLIDIFAMVDGSAHVIAGVPTGANMDYKRKSNIYKGNPEAQASFGTNEDDTEWIQRSAWDASLSQYGYPGCMIMNCSDLGNHFMDEPTMYMSTVTSVAYKVSDGFSVKEKIRGLTTGTTVSSFLSNIFKADEGQTLTVKATADGSELTGDAVLSMNDTLVVLSADSVNTTKYILDVSTEGLNSDAVLVSSKYEITVNGNTGSIAGLEYGTSLKTVMANITVPAGATLQMIDGNGAFVPFKLMNFDTTYVNVTVSDNVYFEVTAENAVDKITYQLQPDVSEKDAFVTSNVYTVVQKEVLIHFVPRGTNVRAFLSNLIASKGATVKLVDKIGMERIDGTVADDDKVVVTSSNGEVSRVYFISMLAEKYVPETTYLAYILSSRYAVDQVDNVVNGVSGDETIAAFYSRITVAQGAIAIVVDKDGNEKTSGDIDGTDKVRVTSADGKIVVCYTFGQLTGAGVVEHNSINLYPNPTNGIINISGIERGIRIQVFNATGSAIRDIEAESSIEAVSLENEPAGMYLIVISDSNKLLGRYKAIKN